MTLRLLYIVSYIVFLSGYLTAQTSCIPTNLNGTVINLACGANCTDLKFKVPHLKSTETYSVNSIPYTPYPYTTSTGNELTLLYNDDKFSQVINLPFNFCFYDSAYSKFVVGSNGIITFDESNAAPCDNSYKVSVPIPYALGTQCLSTSVYYPRASIMCPFSDLDPQAATNPPDRKIEWRIEGTAPCRRLIVSYYHVTTYDVINRCSTAINTFQTVIYESTGIIDFFLQDKPLCTLSTSGGNAILGIQNWAQNKGIAAPLKNATPWSAVNEGYRFTPNGNSSRFVKAELCDINGTVLGTTGPTDTSTTTQGLLDVNFLNICPPAGTTKYLVKSYFSSCTNAGEQLIGIDTVTINKNLNATVTSTPTACGTPSGHITITAVGGTPPFEYSLDGAPFQSSNLYIDVPAGNHTVVMRDASGCVTSSIPVVVTSGPAILATITTTATSCDAAVNGSLSVTPLNGISPYQYSLDAGPWLPGSAFNNIAAGNHTVRVQDGSGCLSAIIPAIVPAGPPISGTAVSTATTCPAANNGTISVTVQSNYTSVTFSLDGGPHQAVPIFTNVAAGPHSVVIYDATGCVSAPIPVTVAVGVSTLNGTISATPASCLGASNGSISIVPNGTGPYEYSLNGGPWMPGSMFANLSPGNYSAVIKDVFGCVSPTLSVTVPTGAPITGTAVVTAPTCAGLNNGTITITVIGNITTTQYSLDGAPRQGSNMYTSVAPGPHSVIIYEGLGCVSAPIQAVVPPGQQIITTLTTTPTSCSGAVNGTITIVPPTTGAPPYVYSIDLVVPFQSSNVFTGLTAGPHSVAVFDNTGCTTGPMPAIVAPGQPLAAALNKTDVDCNGAATGTITVAISTSGVPPFGYSIDGSTYQNSNVFTNLLAGNYTVYFRDNNSCSGTQSVTINEPPVLSATLAAQPVRCNGQNNGVITVTAAGGTAPYEYSLTGISYQASNIFNVRAGAYTVYIRDSKGCSQTRNISVTEPPLLTVNIAGTQNATCNGGNNGSITASASGGTPPYQFSTDGINFQASGVLSVGPGNFTITVKDNAGCILTSNPAIVGLTNNLTVTPLRDTVICEGQSVKLNAITNATQFAWTPANSLSGSSTASPTASPTVTTQYILTATLGRCSLNDTIIVNVLPAPVPDAGPDGNICYGQSYQLQGSGGVRYQWSPSTGLSSTIIPDPVATPNSTMQYSLHVIDPNNCQSLSPAIVHVYVTPPIVIKTHPVDTVVSEGDVIQFMATSVGTTYSWSPATGLNNPGIPNPVATVTTDITYKVETTTAAGCKGEAQVILRVYKGPDLYVPTAFTPNKDGRNDKFKPFPVGIKELKYFRVYNRWGQLVFSTKTLNDGWDGKFGFKEEPTGTYVWVVEGITKDDKVINKKGTVTLIR